MSCGNDVTRSLSVCWLRYRQGVWKSGNEDDITVYNRLQFANIFVCNDEIGWTCTMHSEAAERKNRKRWLVDLIRRECRNRWTEIWKDILLPVARLFFFLPNFVKTGQIVRMLRVIL